MLSDDRAEPKGIRIREKYAYYGAILFIALFVIFGASIIYTTRLTNEIAQYNILRSQSFEVKEKMERYKQSFKDLDSRLQAISTQDQSLRQAMGLEVNEWSRYLYADSDGDRRFAVRGLG